MRTRLAVLLVFFGVGSAPALAEEGLADQIGEQIQACWALPPLGDVKSVEVVLDVKLEGGNVVDIDAVRYTPETPLGEAVARSAARAVQRCAPYPAAPDRFEITLTHSSEEPIDPFDSSLSEESVE